MAKRRAAEPVTFHVPWKRLLLCDFAEQPPPPPLWIRPPGVAHAGQPLSVPGQHRKRKIDAGTMAEPSASPSKRRDSGDNSAPSGQEREDHSLETGDPGKEGVTASGEDADCQKTPRESDGQKALGWARGKPIVVWSGRSGLRRSTVSPALRKRKTGRWVVAGCEHCEDADREGIGSAQRQTTDKGHNDEFWQYNTFQYWRNPLPPIDLADIEDLNEDTLTEATLQGRNEGAEVDMES
ncbi:PREDICTED: uncharacterized protein C9orf40 homolog [Colobus angolensis palliatus]|uniref:uncharacterized protein C9orf40 homolog n=1 Tax=Colobus angolensis palliatus TaxID=336983 RepID=UPI0005F504F4|nr:PREDICTED: uncharacterized protein C9orf40 homolog [Colobus angolensis palliatus]